MICPQPRRIRTMTADASEPLAQIGVVGMAVMGSNLARNFASKGHTVAIYNRSPEKTRAVINEYGHEGNFIACLLYTSDAADDAPRV